MKAFEFKSFILRFFFVLSSALLAFFLFYFSIYGKKESFAAFFLDGAGKMIAQNASFLQKERSAHKDGHVATPVPLKAVYISQCGASSAKIRARIDELLNETELNAVVIDIKDYTGTVSFPSKIKGANDGKGCIVKDMKEYIEDLHKRGVYVIGRITVFQDPLYAEKNPQEAVQSKSKAGPWSDYKGLHFIDVGSKKFWRYIVKISKEAHQDYEFDELNYDYVRYPSDGPMKDAFYTLSNYDKRQEELERFFRYLHNVVKVKDKAGHEPVISADLFGMVTTNFDDLTIGQVLERALPYFDYIAPMVYPSHYPKSFLGLGNPNKNVYKVVNYCMKRAVERTVATSTKIASFSYEPISTSTPHIYKKPAFDKNKLRPWLQDFDYGGNYGAREVREQIKAVYDAGLHSWMLWDPANVYTKEALKGLE